MFGIKRSNADKWFSDYIRLKAGYQCERCKKIYEKGDNRLHNSHFHSRRNRSVRFDPENVAALCFGCHRAFTENPHEHSEFFVKRLGREKYDALARRARIPQKVDESLIVLWCKAEIAKIKAVVLK